MRPAALRTSRGHLFQARIRSFVLDEWDLIRAARYVEINPVKAGLAKRPEAQPRSSAGLGGAGIVCGK